MPEFKTKNNVLVLFDKNEITTRDGDKPLLSFDAENNLISVNFYGYTITPKEDTDNIAKNKIFELGKKAGREEVQEGIKNLLNIKECFCSDCLDT